MSLREPLISIMMPVYNGEQYLAQAIGSVINQSFLNYEFIIVNDACTDKSVAIINEFSGIDERIKLLHNKKRLGVVKSLNIAVREAKGKFIARIDADDIWHNQKLEKQLAVFKTDSDLEFLASSKIEIDKNGNAITGKPFPGINLDEKLLRERFLHANVVCHSSVLFKKSIINKVGSYNEKYKNSEDYEYWIRIAKVCKCLLTAEALVYYRITMNMVSMRRKQQQAWYAIKAKILAKRLYNSDRALLKLIYPNIIDFFKPRFLIRIKKKLVEKRFFFS